VNFALLFFDGSDWTKHYDHEAVVWDMVEVTLANPVMAQSMAIEFLGSSTIVAIGELVMFGSPVEGKLSGTHKTKLVLDKNGHASQRSK